MPTFNSFAEVKKEPHPDSRTPLFQSLETYWVWNEKAEMVRQVSFSMHPVISLAVSITANVDLFVSLSFATFFWQLVLGWFARSLFNTDPVISLALSTNANS